MLENLMKNVSVIGAAGKMGSGIALLLLQEMAQMELAQTGSIGSGEFSLTLIDINERSLQGLRNSLRSQILKYAEKNINALRQGYDQNKSLVSNEEIIRAFVEGTIDITRFSSDISGAKNSKLVFEAILENVEAKKALFDQLKAHKTTDQYYFSNTSSIPIEVLNRNSQLDNRIIGYHFYNPPAVQKLLEIIAPKNMDSDLMKIGWELAKRLRKKVVVSQDVAGFIGNGHFSREVLFACALVREVMESQGFLLAQSIYIINKLTQEYLIRPMGIFQLIDYVGIDVVQNILKIMNLYLPDLQFKSEIIDRMISGGVLGGQNQDGTQKNGFFQYQHHVMNSIYNIDGKKYLSLDDEPFEQVATDFLGPHLDKSMTWKNLQNHSNKNAKIKEYLQKLMQENSNGGVLAKRYLQQSRQIALDLVKDKVAQNIDDVDTVLENGFFHLYGVTECKKFF